MGRYSEPNGYKRNDVKKVNLTVQVDIEIMALDAPVVSLRVPWYASEYFKVTANFLSSNGGSKQFLSLSLIRTRMHTYTHAPSHLPIQPSHPTHTHAHTYIRTQTHTFKGGLYRSPIYDHHHERSMLEQMSCSADSLSRHSLWGISVLMDLNFIILLSLLVSCVYPPSIL